MVENIPALIAEARERHRRTARHLPDPTSPTLVSRLADALESLSAPPATDDDREVLIALKLASVLFTASDGYPSTRIRSNEEAADLVVAAGFRRPSPVTREAVKQMLAENGFTPNGGHPHSWRCEHPDRYPGACRCVDEMTDDIMRLLSVSPPQPVQVEVTTGEVAPDVDA